jgi:hypothetical protein
MDYFEKRLPEYAEANQAVCKAKRAFIQAMYDVLSISKIVENVKDDKSFEDVFGKYTNNTKSSIWKNIVKLSKSIKDTDKTVKAYRDTLAKPPGKVVGGGGAAPSNVIVPDSTEDHAPVAPPTPKPTVVKPPKKSKKDKITLAMREQIWKKYIGRVIDCPCPVCQTRLISMTDFSAGHIIAESTGGATDITNLVPICGNCNSRMSTMDLFEYTQKNYMRAPVFPVLEEKKEKRGDTKH